MNTQLSTLANGIRVITCEMPQTQSATFGIWTAVGGRHEPLKLAGISHFIEHMLFKGTHRRTARQIGQEIEGVGGYLNATTTHDHTVYYGSAPADRFQRLSSVLCDMYLSPRFAEADIRKERCVITEEIQMYLDEPSELVQEILWEELWPNHALGRSLTGSVESISRLTKADFLRYRETHYHGSNTVVSAAGCVKHDVVVKRVDELLGSLPRGRRTVSRPAPALPERPRVRIVKRDTQQTHLALAVPSCDLHSTDRYGATLLNILLAGNMSSRLFQELREKRGICYTVSSNVSHYEDTGVVNFYVGLDCKNVPKTLDLLCREFRRLRTSPVHSAELKRAKDYAIGSSRMSLERTSSQNSRIGYSALFYGDAVDPEKIHDRLQSVTPDDIQRICQASLVPNRTTMTVVGPVEPDAPFEKYLS